MTGPTTGPTPPEAAATPVQPPPAPSTASTGELVGALTEQISTLVRDEGRLTQAEGTRKIQRLGVGALLGLFTVAGVQRDIATVKEGIAR
jgi:Putative Actinobacterial Holin-X, holin superfamily III